MCCKLLWARHCGATACKGRVNGRCRAGPFDGRRASIDGPMGRTAGCTRRGRGRAVVACAAEVVTHFLRTRTISAARTHSHALRTLAPHICAHTVPRLRHSRTPRAAHARTGTHCTALHQARTHYALFFAYRFFFIAIVSRNAIFASV